jgi:hypothetical protein
MSLWAHAADNLELSPSLDAARRAVEIYQELARQWPAASERNLAAAIHTHAELDEALHGRTDFGQHGSIAVRADACHECQPQPVALPSIAKYVWRCTVTSQLNEHVTSASLPKGRGKGPGGQPRGLLPPSGSCPVAGCGEPIGRRLMCRQDWNDAGQRPGF